MPSPIPTVEFEGATLVESGMCRYCGCTEDRACPNGCFWIDLGQTVCSGKDCMDRFFGGHARVVGLLVQLMRGGR